MSDERKALVEEFVDWAIANALPVVEARKDNPKAPAGEGWQKRPPASERDRASLLRLALERGRNLGVSARGALGAIIIEVDGAEDLAAVKALDPGMPLRVLSGHASGEHCHLYWAKPDDWPEDEPRWLRFEKGNVTHNSGYFVGVGSVHPDSGLLYRPLDPLGPLPPMKSGAAARLLDAVTQARVEAAERDPEAKIAEGERHAYFLETSRSLALEGLDAAEIVAVLRTRNETRFETPKPEGRELDDELLRVAESAVEKYGRMGAVDRILHGPTVARPPLEVVTAKPAQHESGIVIPKGGFLRAVVDLLGGSRSEAPDELIYVTSLAALSAVIGWRARMAWGREGEPVTLFVMGHGNSASSHKTTVLRSVMDVFRAVGPDRLKLKSTSHASNRGLLELVEHRPPPQLTEEELKAYEDGALADIFKKAEQDAYLDSLRYPPGVLIGHDEFESALTGPEWRKEATQELLRLYNGHYSAQLTGQRKTAEGKCAVALIATVTEEGLAAHLNAGHGRSGFLGRFLWVPLPSQAKGPVPFPTPEDDELAKRVADWLRKLGAWTGDLGGVHDVMTADARDAYATWYERRYYETTGRDLEEALFRRGQATVMKAATLLAIAELETPAMMGERGGSKVRITHRNVADGVSLIEGGISTAMRLLETAPVAQIDRWADKCFDYLQANTKQGEALRLSDLLRNVRVPKEDRDRLATRDEQRVALTKDGRFTVKERQGKGGGWIVGLA